MPNLPASLSGAVSSTRRSASGRSSSGVPCSSRRSGGSDSAGAEWRDSARWAFTSKVKPGGVTSTQP